MFGLQQFPSVEWWEKQLAKLTLYRVIWKNKSIFLSVYGDYHDFMKYENLIMKDFKKDYCGFSKGID